MTEATLGEEGQRSEKAGEEVGVEADEKRVATEVEMEVVPTASGSFTIINPKTVRWGDEFPPHPMPCHPNLAPPYTILRHPNWLG